MSRSSASGGRRRVALESIGVIGTGVAAGQGLASLAQGIGRFVDGLNEVDAKAQVEKAQLDHPEIVTRDVNNKIVLQANPFSNPQARQIFARQQESRYFDELTNDAKVKARDIHIANSLDPAAFEASWKGYTEGALAEVPKAFREDARRKLTELGITHRNDVAVAQANNAKAMAASAFKTELGAAENDALSLAQAGRHTDPEYLVRFGRYNEILLRGVDNQFLTPEAADLYRRQVAEKAEGLGIASIAEKAYAKAGRGSAGVAAAEKFVKDLIIGNPDSSLDPSHKETLANIAMGRIRNLESDRRIAVQDATAKADADMERIRLGINVDLTTLDSHRKEMIQLGEPEKAQKIGQMMTVSGEVRATAQQPLSEIDRRIGELDAKRRDGTATAAEGEAAIQLYRIRETKAKHLTEDAFSYGLDAHRELVGAPAALDFNNPDKLAAAIETRSRQARVISDREGVPVAPFTKPELAQIASLASSRESPGEQLDFIARVTVDLKDESAANVVLDSLARHGISNHTDDKSPVKGQTKYLRTALDIYAGGDPVRARRVWAELSRSEDSIPIAADVSKAVVENVASEYRGGIGAVLALQHQMTLDPRYSDRFNSGLDAATKIARVRAGASGDTRTGGGAIADLFGDQRGIAERGFAAVTFPASTNMHEMEEGMRSIRTQLATDMASRITDPLARRQFERVSRDAVWINAGDGYTLTLPGSGAPVPGPDGRPIRYTLDQIVTAGKGVVLKQADEAAAAKQGIGGVVSSDDPLAALSAASKRDRERNKK